VLALITTNGLSRVRPSEKNVSSVEENKEIKRLQAQMTDLQLEVDLIRETLNVLKKTPAST
jgi:hypothetical protein